LRRLRKFAWAAGPSWPVIRCHDAAGPTGGKTAGPTGGTHFREAPRWAPYKCSPEVEGAEGPLPRGTVRLRRRGAPRRLRGGCSSGSSCCGLAEPACSVQTKFCPRQRARNFLGLFVASTMYISESTAAAFMSSHRGGVVEYKASGRRSALRDGGLATVRNWGVPVRRPQLCPVASGLLWLPAVRIWGVPVRRPQLCPAGLARMRSAPRPYGPELDRPPSAHFASKSPISLSLFADGSGAVIPVPVLINLCRDSGSSA